MLISTLRTKARKNTLEVEHILAAAKAGVPGLREELSQLSIELNWSASACLSDGTRVVPLAKWAEIAGAYAEQGMSALAVLANKPENAVYIIGLLETLGSLEAVDALNAIFRDVMHKPGGDTHTAWCLVYAYNQLLSFKKSPIATSEQENTIRAFLNELFPLAESDAQRASLICTLRGVGDEASIQYLSNIAELPYPYESLRRDAIRVIRQRLRARP
ncbi:hypothetical protein [Undibacterium pigrum]|uniref:Uncharacterized protein n=1 Tax=Undibacterium pigrum TaxID=401470 RepID=A0A318J1E7_9BURK|nr:hypothetical protein [Undibacterium pigrum]PXX41559.1 hypothetical protein DFR42_107210 [Undibacterium pigrum]